MSFTRSCRLAFVCLSVWSAASFRARSYYLDVDAVEQVVQRPFLYDDTGGIWRGRLWDAEDSRVQSFIEKTEAATVKEEHLECCPSLPEENEESAASAMPLKPLLNNASQFVESPA